MKTTRTMLSVQATPDISAMRTQSLMDQVHTVIPCIALVEGVLWPANAPGPELALAEEFGRFPQGWNGRPVTYDHPKVNGEPVSASSPDVLQSNAFGQLFNTTLEDGKLKTEIWINEARIAELSEDAQATIQSLKDGSGVAEVSTGLFTMSEARNGVWEGREYGSVWRNIVPDHLAVLPEGITGACSVADGCGAPRLNTSNTDSTSSDATEWQPVMRAAQLRTDCKCTEAPEEIEGKEVGIIKRFLENALKHFNITNDDEEPEFVDPTISNTPNSTTQENAMSKEALVTDLIANKATQFTEDDSEWLSTLEEETLTKMVPVVANTEATEQVTTEEVTEEVVTNSKPVTTADYVAAAPAEVQAVLNAGLKMHQSRKDALVGALTANKRCRFTADQLNEKSIEELENIAALAQDITYEGAAPSAPTTNEAPDTGFTPAPSVFEIN